MPTNLSIDKITGVEIPEVLADSSEEESIFKSTEAGTHKDHKQRQAAEQVLDVAKQRIRTLEIENDDLAKMGPHRRTYSWWVFGFSTSFVISSLVIVLLSSWQIPASENAFKTLIKLDTSILITLLSTNMVQVVGLLFIVAKWLYPSIDKK